jgi:hypothetical protein
MKTEFLAAFVSLAALCAGGQGSITYQYDQQSSTNEFNLGYSGGTVFQVLGTNTGQAFTPTLSGVDFIRLKIGDGNPNDGLGSSWFLNLRSTSITGPILGTTATVDLPNGFTGVQNFFFPNTIPLTPGTQYFFDVNTPDGASWRVDVEGFNYPGGNGWANGHEGGGDYWFREGIIVPEPSPAALLLLGGAAFACLRLVRHK